MLLLKAGYPWADQLKMFNKKAIVTSPADLVKGFIVGLILGMVVVYLIAKGIIPYLQFLF